MCSLMLQNRLPVEEPVSTSAFSDWQRVRVHALLVGNRIDLRALYRGDSLTVAPLAISAGERGMAVVTSRR